MVYKELISKIYFHDWFCLLSLWVPLSVQQLVVISTRKTGKNQIYGDSGFFGCLNSYDEVMADRGFQITEELMLK